jgi:hypothetical protein
MSKPTLSRGSIRAAFAAAVALVATAALAWNYDDLWQYKADAARPGGGGNFATGSKTDRSLQCVHCHIGSAGTVNLGLSFSPQLGTVNGKPSYAPNTRYTITAALQGEHLSVGVAGQVNNFAATFEDATGKVVGIIESDSGQKQGGPCPANILNSAALDAGSTTITMGDCRAIVGRGRVKTNQTQWQFFWTAPPAGAGQVTIYWGVTDGDDKENSIGDDSKMGTMLLEQG